MLLRCVREVGQQREKDIRKPVGQVADFEVLHQPFRAFRRFQEGRNDDDGPMIVRNAFREIHARQPPAADGRRGDPVHEGHCRPREGEQRCRESQDRPCPGRAQAVMDFQRERRRQKYGQHENGQQIGCDRRGCEDARDAPAQGRPILQFPFEFRAPLVEHEPADVRFPLLHARLAPLRREPDGRLGDLLLAQRAPFGERLDDMPALVPRLEIRPGVHAQRVAPQRGLRHAERFDELRPGERADPAQTGDAAADGDLIGGFFPALRPLNQLDGLPALRELLLDPVDDQPQRGRFALDVGDELGDERAGHRRIRAHELGQRGDHSLRRLRSGGDEAARPLARQGVGAVPQSETIRHPSEVLDQRQAHHHRHGPQFSEVQRRNGLVGLDETREVIHVHAPVRVGDQLQRKVIDAGESLERTGSQAGQFPAVSGRENIPGDGDLLLDQVEVIEKPLGRLRKAPAPADRFRDNPVRFADDRFILCEAMEEFFGTGLWVHPMAGGRRPGVGHELNGTEYFRAERRLSGVRWCRPRVESAATRGRPRLYRMQKGSPSGRCSARLPRPVEPARPVPPYPHDSILSGGVQARPRRRRRRKSPHALAKALIVLMRSDTARRIAGLRRRNGRSPSFGPAAADTGCPLIRRCAMSWVAKESPDMLRWTNVPWKRRKRGKRAWSGRNAGRPPGASSRSAGTRRA